MDADWERAALAGDATELRWRLEKGCDIDAKDRHGQTALMLAARHGHLEAVVVLLEAGPDLDHTAKHKLSALMLAAINGHLAVVQALAEAGADLRLEGSGAPGFSGKTALDIADDMDRPEIVAALRDRLARSQ